MSLDSREFRNALGRFATGVCVVAAKVDGKPAFGMTVNSFSSLSLDPPLVLWSLQNNSEMFADWEAASGFSVNILSLEQLEHSNRYAKKGQHELLPEHFSIGKTGNPVIKGCLANFECDVEQRVQGGDHVIYIGRVKEAYNSPTGKPLLFAAGKYGEIR